LLIGEKKFDEPILKKDHDYVIKDNQLSFQINKVMDVLRQAKRDHNYISLELPDDFAKQLQYADYFVSKDTNVRFKLNEITKTTYPKKCYVLDLSKMGHLDIPNLDQYIIPDKKDFDKVINLSNDDEIEEIGQDISPEEQKKLFWPSDNTP